MRLAKFSAAHAFIETVSVAADATYNTREASAINGKPYLVPIEDGSRPEFDPAIKNMATTFVLEGEGAEFIAVETFTVIDKSAEEMETYERHKAALLLSTTDARVARVVEELYQMIKGERDDISDEGKELFASREDARSKLP